MDIDILNSCDKMKPWNHVEVMVGLKEQVQYKAICILEMFFFQNFNMQLNLQPDKYEHECCLCIFGGFSRLIPI